MHFFLQKFVILGLPRWAMRIYQHSTQAFIFAIMVGVIIYKDLGFVQTIFLLFGTVIHFCKMHSYTETNYLFKEESEYLKKRGLKPLTNYPNNVKLRDFVYFIMAPTLVYWHHYPKNRKIRWNVVLQALARVAIGFVTVYLIACENMFPIFEQGKNLSLLDAALRLAIPFGFSMFFSLI